jgi:hypothetical protein
MADDPIPGLQQGGAELTAAGGGQHCCVRDLQQ